MGGGRSVIGGGWSSGGGREQTLLLRFCQILFVCLSLALNDIVDPMKGDSGNETILGSSKAEKRSGVL